MLKIKNQIFNVKKFDVNIFNVPKFNMPNSAAKFNVGKFSKNIRGPNEEQSILDARSGSSKESGNKSVTRFFFFDTNVNSKQHFTQ
jgi:hypothetical protein